jgi:hypothetical protein
MENNLTGDAIVCDLSAIPADQREAHVALGKSLLTNGIIDERDDEVRVEVEADRFGDVTRFIGNERLCCRHLSFALDVPARGANLVLRVSGPGVRDELQALIR